MSALLKYIPVHKLGTSPANCRAIVAVAFILILVLSAHPRAIAQQQASTPDSTQLKVFDRSTSHPKAADTPPGSPELVVQAGHTKPIFAIAFSPDGRWMATGSQDLTIKIWDLSTGVVLRTIQCSAETLALAVSPDSQTLASGAGIGARLGIPDASGPFEVALWHVSSGTKLKSLGTHVFSVEDLAFSRDGHRLTSVSGDAIKVWDTQTGQNLHSSTITYEMRTGVYRQKRQAVVGGIGQAIVSPNGELAAIGVYNMPYTIYDAISGSEVSKTKVKAEFGTSATFSPDGSLIAFFQKGNTIIKSVRGGPDLHVLDSGQAAIGAEGGVRFSPDGRTLLMSRVQVGLAQPPGFTSCDVSTGHCARLPGSPSSEGGSSIFGLTPDGRLIAAVHGSEVKLTNAVSGKDERVLSSEETIPIEQTDVYQSFVNNPRALEYFKKKTGLSTPEQIRAYAETHREQLEQSTRFSTENLPGTYKNKDVLAFTSDGRWLVGRHVRLKNTRLEAWSTSTGTPVRNLDTSILELTALPGSSSDGRFTAVAVHPGRSVAAGIFGFRQPHPNKDPYIYPQEVELSDARSGGITRSFKLGKTDDGGFVPAIGFSTEGDLIAMTGFNENHQGRVFVYETGSGNQIAELTMDEEIGALRNLTMSSKTRAMALNIGSRVDVIDIATNRSLWTAAVRQGVSSLTFNPSGGLLAILDAAGNKEIRNASSGENLATLVNLAGALGGNGNEWLVVTPDGLFDGSPASFGHILWRFSGDTFDVAPVELFFNEFYYPGLLADILRGKHPKPAQSISQKDRRQPHITLKSPEANFQPLSKRMVNLEIQIGNAPAGARDVRLFRNGSLVQAWHGDILKQSSSVLLKASVPVVAGVNNFTAYAFNKDDIKSADALLTLLGAESLRQASTAYVLAIGLSKYANSDYDLKYAVNDAQSFAEEFERQQAKVGRFAQVKIVRLLDENATKANILLALDLLRAGGHESVGTVKVPELQNLRPAQPEDAVIVYYAGHGTAKQARFYLIPHDLGYTGSRSDLDEAGVDMILRHSISDQELSGALENVDAGQLLLVIDACNSGQALEAEEKRRGPMNSKGLAQLAYEKGIDILTAAQSYQAAIEAQQLGHGYLTYALIEEGLKTPVADTSPRDGQVDVREWLDYAAERVPQMQEVKIKDSRRLGREISFAQPEQRGDSPASGVQRPRAFYRREIQYPAFIVAKPGFGGK